MMMISSTMLLKICMAVFVSAASLISISGAHVRQKARAKVVTASIQRLSVDLTEKGYEPPSLKLRKGIPASITFTRKVSPTCATEVVLPEYGIKRALPLGEPVVIEFTPDKAGDFNFSCGMGMIKRAGWR